MLTVAMPHNLHKMNKGQICGLFTISLVFLTLVSVASGQQAGKAIAQEYLNISLSEGWNLISIPGVGELNQGDCGRYHAPYAYVYVGELGRYISIIDAKKHFGEELLYNYLSKNAFWAYSYEECNLTFKPQYYTSYENMTLAEGLNLLPITKDMVGIRIYDIMGDCELNQALLWNITNQRWDEIKFDFEFIAEQIGLGFVASARGGCTFSNNPVIEIDTPDSVIEVNLTENNLGDTRLN
jgi:hypothetical protein